VSGSCSHSVTHGSEVSSEPSKTGRSRRLHGSSPDTRLDSFITDSANSASALFTGKKMTVNGLNAYTDSTGKPFGDPKVETVFEMFRRVTGGQVGIGTSGSVLIPAIITPRVCPGDLIDRGRCGWTSPRGRAVPTWSFARCQSVPLAIDPGR